MTSHLDEGLLHELLDGEIPSTALGPIQAHLGACAECRARLEVERALLSEADRLVERLEVPGARDRQAAPARPATRWGRNLAWAATVVLAAGLGYALRGPGVQPPLPAGEASPIAAIVPTVAEPADTLPPTNGRFASTSAPESRRSAEKEELADVAGLRKATASKDPLRVQNRLDEAVVASGPEEKAAQAAPQQIPQRLEQQQAAPPTAFRNVAPQLGAAGKAQQAFTDSRDAQVLDRTAVPIEEITFSQAVGRLGGKLRLVEGLVPLRLEAQGESVRVIYPLSNGELVLVQRLVAGKVEFRLAAPAGFPADSLERLRARVRE
ncbi:MAG: hypothetical protein HOP28_14620 [Gemmatimonadales bacterium]|nr:hypothetical protein [Gemmatimonadales bacterium]